MERTANGICFIQGSSAVQPLVFAEGVILCVVDLKKRGKEKRKRKRKI